MSGVAPPWGELGAHTFGLAWEMDAAAAVEALAAHGFRRFELIAMPPHLDAGPVDAAALRRLRRAVEGVGGEILAIDLPSNDVNLASTAPEVVAFAVERYRAAIRVAGEIGARWTVVLPGRRHGLLPPPDDRLVDVLHGALDRLAQDAGAAGTRLLMENHPQALLPDADALARFLTAGGHGGVDVLYDVANAAAIGEDLGRGLDAVRLHLAMVHLSDAPAGAWRHDPIGTGAIDFARLRGELNRIGFTGALVTEIIAPGGVARLVEARSALRGAGWPV